MDISIVIVNYNSWSVLNDCLLSIQNLDTKLTIETIIIDNQSPNDLLEQYQKKYPSFKWIKNTGNNGFANGCNLGTTHSNARYLFFLNPDTLLQNNVLEHFIAIYQKENIGLLSCLQTNQKGNYHKYNLLFPTPFRTFGLLRAIERKFLKNRFKETTTRSYPDWLSGSAIFISKENLEKINHWNEDYWMYYEDVDLCKKAHLNNLNCVVTKEVSLFHLHGGASRINPKTKAITKSEVLKSRHTYIDKYFTSSSKLWLQPLLVTNTLCLLAITSLLSFPLFFIKKLKVNRYKWNEMTTYYKSVISTKRWLSNRSMNL